MQKKVTGTTVEATTGSGHNGVGYNGQKGMNAKSASAMSKPQPSQQHSITDRIAMLGIPKEECTQAVVLAVSALLEKLDDTTHELTSVHEHLTEMQQLVDVDCLAPIPNRRAFMRRLKWAISMRDRYEHPSSILYFDLNRFKEINDTHGHAAGDQVIQYVSEIFKKMLRETDFVARIGGDEFAIIMYYAEEADARKRAQTISEEVKNSAFTFNGAMVPLSTSYGVYTLQKGEDPETALSNADIAMYVDKRRHRESMESADA